MARLIYLPAGRGAKKQGVDDYLASGHSVDELLSHATPELRRPPLEDEPEHPYRASEATGGLVWDKPTQNGSVPTQLTNFTARIKADVSEDDGAEVERGFEIEAMLSGRRYAFTVSARQFPGMGWVAEHLEAGALVQPGFGVKDHARAAIQTLSGEIPTRRVFAHTGWRKIDGDWLYLHAGGAIGGSTGDEGTEPRIELSGALRERGLPLAQPEDAGLREAVRASLALLEVVPGGISYPLLAAAYRAPLGESDFSIHLSARYEDLRNSLKEEHAELRRAAGAGGQHRRTPGIVADLALGLRYFLLYAHESGAMDRETARELWTGGWRALGEAAFGQSQHQAAGEPTHRFRELLAAAIASGRAHFANPEGGEPEISEAWGWRQATVGSGDFEREEWRPQGERVG